MEKKYKLTDETINVNGKTLYRIKSLKDFGNVKKGDKGGFVEKEDNLSQSDNCWVYGDAKVSGNAKVFGNAVVRGNAKVSGNAKVFGDARVFGNAQVYGNAMVYNYAKVYGNAEIFNDAKIYDDAEVCGDARICADAKVESNGDYIVFKNWWSSGRYFTWTKNNNMWKVGCFYGTGEQLIEKAYKDSDLSGKEYKRVVDYVNSIKDNKYNHVRKNIKERLLSKIRKLFVK